MKVDGPKFLVEKSHPLLSRIHVAAAKPARFIRPGDGEILNRSGSCQETNHIQQIRMIETVVMLSIGLSMAGVVLGNLRIDESV
ncbi:hypothetical protein OBA47_01445 [bacterium]|nr:hypothetical protein [bacterium]